MHEVWMKWPPTGELKKVDVSDHGTDLVPLMVQGWIQATAAEIVAAGKQEE